MKDFIYYKQILKESQNKSEIIKYLPYRAIGIKYKFKENVIMKADGLIMNCGKDMENCLVSCSLYEREIKKEIDKLNGGIFIDVGSHIGKWSIYASKKVDKVISIEPTEETFNLQNHNINKNRIHNIDIFNTLLSDNIGEVSFYESIENPANNSLQPALSKYPFSAFFKKHNVKIKKTILLDNLIKGRKNIKLIKIDVEGSELKVLKGAKKVINSNKPKIIFESNDKEHLREIIDYFHNINYGVRNLEGINNYLATPI